MFDCFMMHVSPYIEHIYVEFSKNIGTYVVQDLVYV